MLKKLLSISILLCLGLMWSNASAATAEKVTKRARTEKAAPARRSAFTPKQSKNSTKSTQMTTPTPITGDVTVDVKTTLGDITLKLYALTPRHRDNFVKNIKDGVYDGVLFHRVINEFMIQTGDPDSKNAPAGKMLGSGDLGYTVEAEFMTPRLFHKRGALAAARTGDQVNPDRRSSASQFYIVTGHKYTPEELNQMEQRMQRQMMQQIFDTKCRAVMDSIRSMQQAGDNAGLQALQEKLVAETEAEAQEHPFKFTAEQREAYTTVGGTPHLDGAYTVFGEVTSGMDIVEKIEKIETDANDRPKDDIRIISMSIKQ